MRARTWTNGISPSGSSSVTLSAWNTDGSLPTQFIPVFGYSVFVLMSWEFSSRNEKEGLGQTGILSEGLLNEVHQHTWGKFLSKKFPFLTCCLQAQHWLLINLKLVDGVLQKWFWAIYVMILATLSSFSVDTFHSFSSTFSPPKLITYYSIWINAQ